MNLWNSISSMAESTSLALSVLRFPFIAKLLALKMKEKDRQKLAGSLLPRVQRRGRGAPRGGWRSPGSSSIHGSGVTRASPPHPFPAQRAKAKLWRLNLPQSL
jgi:hypothetical protein